MEVSHFFAAVVDFRSFAELDEWNIMEYAKENPSKLYIDMIFVIELPSPKAHVQNTRVFLHQAALPAARICQRLSGAGIGCTDSVESAPRRPFGDLCAL